MPCPAVPNKMAVMLLLDALVAAWIILIHRYMSHQLPAIRPRLAKGKGTGKFSFFLADIHTTNG